MVYPDGDRFAIDLPDNHQAWLWCISLLSLMFSIVILSTRVMVKWGLFGLDDVALGVAYAISIAQWIILYVAMSGGLGKAMTLVTRQEGLHAAQLVFASQILLLLATSLTKASVMLFVRQLFTRENQKAWKLCTISVGVMLAWGLISALTVSVGCSPWRIIDTGDDSNEATRWRVVTAIDIVLECVLIALPAYLFAGLQMNLQRKLVVIIAFAFRILVALIFIAFLLSYLTFLSSGAPNIGIVPTLSWQQILLCYALMSATIPVLKGFIGRFKTADLVRIDPNSSAGRYGASYALDTMRSATHKHGDIKLRPDGPNEITTDVYHDNHNGEGGSIASGDSEQMIIHRRVDFTVH